MADDLIRCTQGLTPAHVALIQLLAARAVGDFLAEAESPDRMPEAACAEEGSLIDD